MRAPQILLLFALVACGPTTPFLSDRPQSPEATYFFSTLSKRKARAVERLVPEHGVVARQPRGKREWLYIIDDPGVGTGIPRFEFQPLKKCEIAVKLERVSDIGGLGVNAGDVRRSERFTKEFKRAQASEAVAFLQALATNPFDAAKKHAPDAWKTVAQDTQVDTTEVGFVVQATAELVTGNPFDPTSRVTLYTLTSRSPYQRASDAK